MSTQTLHGEYKVPGGKLLVADFSVEEGALKNVQLSGDFFLEPDESLELMNQALEGCDAQATIQDIAQKIKDAIPANTVMLGFSPEAVGTVIRRALSQASQWRDYEWEILRHDPISPQMNAALDEVLTRRVGEGIRKPCMRIWEWDTPAVFIGSFQSVKNEVDTDAVKELGTTIVRRLSGGGAMYMVPEHCLTYAICLPESLVSGMSFPDSYAFLDEWVLEALHSLGVNASYAPLNDIVSPSGKIGGAAQKRLTNGGILHHATIAYDMDGKLMLKVLRIGREKISDKGLRSANKRVDPLRTQTGLSREQFLDCFVDVFTRRHGAVMGEITPEEWAEAEKLVETKFGTEEWTHRIP